MRWPPLPKLLGKGGHFESKSIWLIIKIKYPETLSVSAICIYIACNLHRAVIGFKIVRIFSLNPIETLKPLLIKTETHKKSFFHRIVSEWNSLPIQIRDSTSVNSFKHQLMLHYKLKLQQSFNVNDLCSGTSSCRCQPCVCNRMKNMLVLWHLIAIFKYFLTFKL